MPHLNWRDHALTPKTGPHPTYQTQLDLALTPELAVELAAELAKAFAPGGTELRLDLPGGWTIYWKLKDQGLSRLQLARPQTGQWVASVHLTAELSQALVSHLGDLGAKGEVRVCDLGKMTSIVNFELVLRPNVS